MNALQLPAVALQAAWLRVAVAKLPPAGGTADGITVPPDETSSAPDRPVRIAVIGESTAAGVGVGEHADGFAGSLAREISTQTHRPVAWQAIGESGATADAIRRRLLPRLDRQNVDLAVLLAGANDTMSRRSPLQWHDDLSTIVTRLTTCADRVIVAAVPPFALFPSMPTALGRFLGHRAAALDEISRTVCAAHPRTAWVDMPGTPPLDFFASDGFHPSSAGYRLWAQNTARHLADWQTESTESSAA